MNKNRIEGDAAGKLAQHSETELVQSVEVNAAVVSGSSALLPGEPLRPYRRLCPQGPLADEQSQMGSNRVDGRLLSIIRACLPLDLTLPDQPNRHLRPAWA